MTEVIYPQIMGLFCTAYVLHLMSNGWRRRQARRFAAQRELNTRVWTIDLMERNDG